VQRHVQRGKGEDSMRNLEDYTKLNPDVQWSQWQKKYIEKW
jgi:hypothetical protein